MAAEASPLPGYYRFHARIYDATRWSFLFGRDRLVRLAAEAVARDGLERPVRAAEVGCGTGRNLLALSRALPGASLTGVDLCRPMLERAGRTVSRTACAATLRCAAYGPDTFAPGSLELIIFSYALTMFNPGWDTALEAAREHLAPGGILAVVDFHNTPAGWFRAWMGVNHVRLDGHLVPELQSRFQPCRHEARPAYGGLWRYFLFLGRK
ncbi:class I SAM-dependent methyltransferase [Solidesulfovibrio magneticus]|uniref:Methyltransferase domain-containing protein n=1 Tax=Solidesulfovibrio magneticus (strain ATCC 700980 / DSM 13731 / RS-1) TaxID=573370 RepID=C4XGX6_SOLM1|nr:class I SAM-dependent methyltransferase [Solidesulfovibrio magneticus]BAH76281.1 hypothetical protein DMR_27900 [Solidesulfovibrio magneticus RS-1]